MDILEDRRLARFPRVITPSIHVEVLEVQVNCRNWSDFEEQLLERYDFDESHWLSKKEFIDWAESPNKAQNTSVLLLEFEKRFSRLSTLDWTMLDMSKVLLLVKSVNLLDREKVGLLLEMDEGLMADWIEVKESAAISTNGAIGTTQECRQLSRVRG